MTFSSLTFITLFFPVVLILYFLFENLRWRNGILLVASLLFYSWGEPVWVLGMIGATAINYVAALFVGENNRPFVRKAAIIIGAIASLSVLFYFKYAAFLFNSFASLFVFYILSYFLLKRMGCLSGCLVSSTTVQKLFCGSCLGG